MTSDIYLLIFHVQSDVILYSTTSFYFINGNILGGVWTRIRSCVFKYRVLSNKIYITIALTISAYYRYKSRHTYRYRYIAFTVLDFKTSNSYGFAIVPRQQNNSTIIAIVIVIITVDMIKFSPFRVCVTSTERRKVSADDR